MALLREAVAQSHLNTCLWLWLTIRCVVRKGRNVDRRRRGRKRGSVRPQRAGHGRRDLKYVFFFFLTLNMQNLPDLVTNNIEERNRHLNELWLIMSDYNDAIASADQRRRIDHRVANLKL